MRETFLAHLTILLECLRKLEKGNDGGIGTSYTIRKTMQSLLKQDNNHTRILAVKLWSARRVIEKEYPRTKTILNNMKIRTNSGGVTRDSVLQFLHQIEEAVQRMSCFCIDLAVGGPWEGGEIPANLRPSVTDTIRAIEYLKEKLET